MYRYEHNNYMFNFLSSFRANYRLVSLEIPISLVLESRSEIRVNQLLFLMEELIIKRENAKSASCEIYKWIGCFAATIGALIVVWPELNVPKNEARFGEFLLA